MIIPHINPQIGYRRIDFILKNPFQDNTDCGMEFNDGVKTFSYTSVLKAIDFWEIILC